MQDGPVWSGTIMMLPRFHVVNKLINHTHFIQTIVVIKEQECLTC